MSGAVKCVEFSPGLCKYLASTVFRELQRYIELFDYISLLDPLFFFTGQSFGTMPLQTGIQYIIRYIEHQHDDQDADQLQFN